MKKARLLTILLFFVITASLVSAVDRDWEKYPAYIEITGAKRVCSFGDVHGAFDQLAGTLEALKVATRDSKDSFKFTWTGQDTILVSTGDMNDRGLYSKQVYDAVMDLQIQAEKAGGKFIVTLGNHEVMLVNGRVQQLANSGGARKKNYQNTIDSFTRDGLNFRDAISEKGVYGKWIRNRPLFAIVNGFMYVHGGLASKPITRSALAADYKDDVTRGDYKKGVMMNYQSVLWLRGWWKNSSTVTANLKALGVLGVIFGHTTAAMGPKGKIIAKDKRLIAMDIGMTPVYGYSNGGGVIMTTTSDNKLLFRAAYPDSPEEILFSIPIPASAYSRTNDLQAIQSR